MLHTRNNTDGNKLVIFSGIALYYGDTYIYYHTSNSCECMGVNGEALQFIKICMFRTSHARIRIRYYKSRALVWTCNEIEGLYDKIIITIVPSYTGKNITCLLPLALLLVLHTCNNSDGNKLVIFSGIAWYYGGKYHVQDQAIQTWQNWYKNKIDMTPSPFFKPVLMNTV